MSSKIYFDDALSQVEFPQFLRDRGLTDESWHNDICPKACLALSQDRTLCVWVAEDELADREWDAQKKFSVAIYPADWSEPFAVGETDSEWACAALVDAVVKREADGQLTELTEVQA